MDEIFYCIPVARCGGSTADQSVLHHQPTTGVEPSAPLDVLDPAGSICLPLARSLEIPMAVSPATTALKSN